jgi:hypothetical protein
MFGSLTVLSVPQIVITAIMAGQKMNNREESMWTRTSWYNLKYCLGNGVGIGVERVLLKNAISFYDYVGSMVDECNINMEKWCRHFDR